MNKSSKIFVAGHRGMVGSAIVRSLQFKGYNNIITATRDQLDLLDQKAVYAFLENERPEYIFIAAAKVGGIHANNTYRADFIFQNLSIESNLIHGAHLAGIQKLMFLGSNCIYPRECPQPIKESYLLTGPLEPTNEMYAVAKIAGIKLCDAYNHQYGHQYISVMPASLFGLNDNYDLNNSHVLPALIHKVHKAKLGSQNTFEVWGTGTPKREFLFVDDLADACIFLMENDYAGSFLNIGTGVDQTIRELAEAVLEVVGFQGELEFDSSKPDGTPRKLLDVSALNALGWKAQTSLKDGIAVSYKDFQARHPN